jgi:hypothetical protein
MGNRSYIVVESKSFATPVTLYGHWSGEDNVTAVNNVLARTDRVGSPDYLTAQFFYEFSTLGKYDGNLSFGIDACGYLTGGEWVNTDTIYVNADTGETSMEQPFNVCGKKLVG